MQDETEAKISQLIEILRLERDVIRNGDFAALPDLITRKEQAMAALKGTHARKLLTAHEMARENQHLLSAALKGVRAVQARLEAIRQASKSYTSYDRHGRAQTIQVEKGSVERRA